MLSLTLGLGAGLLSFMTMAQARQIFSDLMQLARTRRLTEQERARLAKARQLIRRNKRPAMNPRDLPPPTAEYLEALEAANHSSRIFREVQQAYRAGRLTDAEYLAARKQYATASESFDRAYAQEEKRARRRLRTNRAPRLSEAVDERLQQMRHMFTSGVSETTGRLVYRGGDQYGGSDVMGRLSGVKPAFPELSHEKAGPQAIAGAISRGKGKVYDRVRDAVARDLGRYYTEGKKRSRGRLSVAPHKALRRYCSHCRTLHAKGEHRFHGAGSFHRTHLFSFNPRGGRRVGRIVEIRYERDWGRQPGFYKHVFRVPASLYRLPDNSILIR